MEGTISGLEPNTEHGLHIHEFGLVVPGSDGSALGGHYNPTGVDHGCPPKSHHAGDFGNIVANAAGAVSFKMSTFVLWFLFPSSPPCVCVSAM